MEGYLNDHAASLMNNSSITIGNDSRYEGKLVATVDKEGAQSSSEWKISFGDIKGEYILMPVTEDEDGNTSVGNLCSDGVGDPYLNYNVTDDGETQEISATVYQAAQFLGRHSPLFQYVFKAYFYCHKSFPFIIANCSILNSQ